VACSVYPCLTKRSRKNGVFLPGKKRLTRPGFFGYSPGRFGLDLCEIDCWTPVVDDTGFLHSCLAGPHVEDPRPTVPARTRPLPCGVFFLPFGPGRSSGLYRVAYVLAGGCSAPEKYPRAQAWCRDGRARGARTREHGLSLPCSGAVQVCFQGRPDATLIHTGDMR